VCAWMVCIAGSLASGQTVSTRVDRRSLETVDGRKLEGRVLNESSFDLQLRTDNQEIHLLRPVSDRYREVTSQTDWPSYNGGLDGNRFTAWCKLRRITFRGSHSTGCSRCPE
jgi:hypothetical protein